MGFWGFGVLGFFIRGDKKKKKKVFANPTEFFH